MARLWTFPIDVPLWELRQLRLRVDALTLGLRPGEETAVRPEEPSQTARPERERFDAALLAALDSAPPDGLSAGELATRVGRSRAWMFSRLDVPATSGRAVRLGRGRWAARRARLLADHGHEIEWVKRNYGVQGVRTWKIRLADRSEITLSGHLEDLGLWLPRAAWPAVGQVKVVAVPKEGWRRFFEYAALERETGDPVPAGGIAQRPRNGEEVFENRRSFLRKSATQLSCCG